MILVLFYSSFAHCINTRAPEFENKQHIRNIRVDCPGPSGIVTTPVIINADCDSFIADSCQFIDNLGISLTGDAFAKGHHLEFLVTKTSFLRCSTEAVMGPSSAICLRDNHCIFDLSTRVQNPHFVSDCTFTECGQAIFRIK